MQSGDVFKIVIGDGWRTVRPGESNHRFAGVDFGRVRDMVDIVVDGTSLCDHDEEDSIFFLVRDMLLAIEKLLEGDGSARVSFYEGPYELMLLRLDREVFITFYRSARRPQILVKDLEVPLSRLKEGVISSAEELVSNALTLDPDASNDLLVRDIRDVLDRISATSAIGAGLPSKPLPKPRQVTSSRFEEPRSEHGFSFGFRFSATALDLLSPGNLKGSDLNTLLFRGRHVVHARGQRVVLGEGYLFLHTERLLASVRQLLGAWEEGRPMSTRLISEGLMVGIRLGADDGLSVSLMDSSREEAIVVLNDLNPWEFADAVIGVARELRRLVVEVNPAQRRNLRLESLRRELNALALWVKEQRRGDVINKDVERYRRLTETRVHKSGRRFLGEASRLKFTERWRIEVEAPDLPGSLLCGDIAVITSRGSLFGIDPTSGAVAWRREAVRSDSRSGLAGPDGYVRATPTGSVEFLDISSGVLRWRTSLEPRTGGAPVLLVIEHGPAPGLVIAAEAERRIVALDMRSGEPRWRFTASRGGRFALRRYGRLLYVSSSDSHFSALDVEDGSLVWRFTDRTRFLVPPATTGDTVLIVGGRPGGPDGSMHALNAFSGERLWSTSLGGGALTAPLISDDAALVPVRVGQRHAFVAVDVKTGEELWRRNCTGWADPASLMTLDGRFVINSAGGTVHSVGARDGETQWSTDLGPSCSDDVPLSLNVVLRGGMLFVPADTVYVVRPEDGKVIHSLGGEPPVPDLLQVDPGCGVFVGEDSGHMAMYDLTRRLSVIPP